MLVDGNSFPGDIIGPRNIMAREAVGQLTLFQQISRVTAEEILLPSQHNSHLSSFPPDMSAMTVRIKSIKHNYISRPVGHDSGSFDAARQCCRKLRQRVAHLPSPALAFRQMYNDLRGFDFTNINRDKYYRGELAAVDFSYANLCGADLRLAWLNGSRFTYANLNTATLFIHSANFFGAALHGTQIILDLPARWSHYHIESLLNGSAPLLATIASISDEFFELKREMMQQVIESLMDNLESIDFYSIPLFTLLKNILTKEFYMQNSLIKGFAGGLIQHVINQSSDQVTLNSLSNSTLSNIIKFIFEPDEENELQCDTIVNNGFFIQLIVRCAYSDNQALRQQARTLYNIYLEQEKIKPFTQKKEFGDGEGKPDWSDTQNLNYILVSGEKTMIIDHDNITRMLQQNKKEAEVRWSNFFLYEKDHLQMPANIDYSDLFNHHFKIFATSYRFDTHKSSLKNLLSLLELAEYDEKFYSVLGGNNLSDEECLTGTEDQFRLNAIFCKVLTPLGDSVKETTLLAEHYKEIMDVFQLRQAESINKAQTLLALAAVFCRYSSSFAFGTVKESPQVLRQYAYALMHKAHELCPDITCGQYDDWKARLLGLHSAFSCTGVLSAAMIEHARMHFPDVACTIIPPAW